MQMCKTSNGVKHICNFCPKWYHSEEKLRAHLLYYHLAYQQKCSTGVAEEQFRRKSLKITKEIHAIHMAKRKPTRYNSNLTQFKGAWKIFD